MAFIKHHLKPVSFQHFQQCLLVEVNQVHLHQKRVFALEQTSGQAIQYDGAQPENAAWFQHVKDV